MLTQLPKGITAIEVSAKISAIMGASDIQRLVDVRRRQVFLEDKLQPSASGCSRPNGPTRVGPQRFWMWPTTLRSSQTV